MVTRNTAQVNKKHGENCNFPSRKAVLQAWNTIFSRLRSLSPWYLYVSTSDLHLQVLRLRRQVSTTGARQAMMGKQPDRKASFSCHNLISDIFQSTINQLSINWMGDHGILKHFADLWWGPQPPLHRWRCHCRRVLRCQHIREHNTSLSRTHPDAQYWTCHEIYIDIPSYQARKSQLNLGAFNHGPFLLKLVTHKSTGMIVENQRTQPTSGTSS